MPKKKLQPSPVLMLQIENAFFTHGYAKLTMERMAQCCNLSRRALYFYFSGKSEAFRAVVRFRNEQGLSTGFAAGQKRWSEGGNALEIFSEIINIRFGDLRRLANASPHLRELNAQVFTQCNDIVEDVAVRFEADLAKLAIEIQHGGLLHLRPDMTAEQVARALANGARGVNQRLPTVAPEEIANHYRDMCRFILYGSAEIPATRQREKRTAPDQKTKRKHT
jgi:AcrR family transcriptional regulator